MENIISMIGTTAFPIVAFLISVYMLKYCFDKCNDENAKNLEQLSELTKAVNENTSTLAKLVTKLGGE